MSIVTGHFSTFPTHSEASASLGKIREMFPRYTDNRSYQKQLFFEKF